MSWFQHYFWKNHWFIDFLLVLNKIIWGVIVWQGKFHSWKINLNISFFPFEAAYWNIIWMMTFVQKFVDFAMIYHSSTWVDHPLHSTDIYFRYAADNQITSQFISTSWFYFMQSTFTFTFIFGSFQHSHFTILSMFACLSLALKVCSFHCLSVMMQCELWYVTTMFWLVTLVPGYKTVV